MYFNPYELNINLGDTVHWINDGGNHNVNFDINGYNLSITYKNGSIVTYNVETQYINIKHKCKFLLIFFFKKLNVLLIIWLKKRIFKNYHL